MKKMESFGGGNNIDDLPVDNNENKNLEQNKEQDKKGFEFSKEDINNGKKRQAIVNFLNAEFSAQMKKGFDLGYADKNLAKRQIFSVQDRLKNAGNNYNADHNDDAFLYVVNDIMDKINQGAEAVNSDETKTKKLENTARIKESIIARNKKGEISDSLMNHKLDSLEKVDENINKDFNLRQSVLMAEKRMKEENERYAEAVKGVNEKEEEYNSTRKKYEAENGGRLTAEQREELKKLRGEAASLWDKRSSLEAIMEEPEEDRKAKLVSEIAKEQEQEAQKAKERRQKLNEILGMDKQNTDNNTVNLNKDNSVDNNEGVTAAQFRQFMRSGVAGGHNRSKAKNEHDDGANKNVDNIENAGEAEKKAALNKRFEAMLPEQGTKARDAYDDGNGILKVILDFDLHKMHKVNVKEMARQEFLDNATIDQRNTNDYLEARAAGLGVKMILDGYNAKDFSRLKKEYGEEAALADLYCKTITMKGKLLAQYDPVEAVKLRGGSKEEIEAAKSQKGVISKEEYEMALNTLNGFARGLMDQLKEDHNLAEYSDAIDLLNNARSSEEYKNLVNGEKVRGYKENEANRLIEERKSLSKDYIRVFIDKGVFGKVKDFLSGINVYRDSSEAKALPGEILKMQNENSGETVRLLGELHLGPIMKNFSKDLGGSDENKLFGAAYVYNELEKKRKELIELSTSREARNLSEQERNDLDVKAKMLYDMMDSVMECYSEKAGVSKLELHNKLLNEMKYNKLSKIRGVIRNLPFMRKG